MPEMRLFHRILFFGFLQVFFSLESTLLLLAKIFVFLVLMELFHSSSQKQNEVGVIVGGKRGNKQVVMNICVEQQHYLVRSLLNNMA
jgi:hypothetical protein